MNIQRPTSNTQRPSGMGRLAILVMPAQCPTQVTWMFEVGSWMLDVECSHGR